MKVVISTCYGGFGLSPEAIEKLFDLKDPHVKWTGFKEYYKTEDGQPKQYGGSIRTREDDSRFLRLPIRGEGFLLDEHDDWYHFSDAKTMAKENTHARECPLLIKMVEEMGEKANSQYSDLTVVEIPDGVQYEIDEYDGFESVHEKHRSWP